jgi:hypothetical protein
MYAPFDSKSQTLLPTKGEIQAGLPDGLFSNQKYQFGLILQGLRLENIDIFSGHLEYFYRHLGYFMITGYILCSFGTFFPVLVSCTKKIWQPWIQALRKEPPDTEHH